MQEKSKEKKKWKIEGEEKGRERELQKEWKCEITRKEKSWTQIQEKKKSNSTIIRLKKLRYDGMLNDLARSLLVYKNRSSVPISNVHVFLQTQTLKMFDSTFTSCTSSGYIFTFYSFDFTLAWCLCIAIAGNKIENEIK